ncbi:MAG: putative inorganic carbon transporter subunit DabA [Myxococcota bacterium]
MSTHNHAHETPRDPRERLRHEVEHASHLLAAQGPIRTFVHHNTLHGLQHLHFDDAIREAERVLGGQGYLPVETFRRLHVEGRIPRDQLLRALEELSGLPLTEKPAANVTVRDVVMAHLLHGVDRASPSELAWEIEGRGALGRLRGDLPADVRAQLLRKAHDELERGVARIGVEWTISDWLGSITGLDVAGHVTRVAASGGDAGGAERALRELGIPVEKRAGYVELAQRRCPSGPDAWLHLEALTVSALAERHWSVEGNLPSLQRHFREHVEAYAAETLWRACLGIWALEDPTSPTDAALSPRDPHGGVAEQAWIHAEEMEAAGGPAVTLTSSQVATVQALLTRADEGDHARLCWTIQRELRAAELGRAGLEALRTLLSLHADEVAARLQEELRTQDPHARMLAHAHDVATSLMDGLAHGSTHRDVLLAVTGVDVNERVHPRMLELCSAFLDGGMATWRMPGRTLGLYDAWRNHASHVLDLGNPDDQELKSALAELPVLPVDAVLQSLRALGVEEEAWGGYLGRILLQLPGWGGMISWMERSGRRERSVDLVQFLAVRLFLERMEIARLARRTWHVEGTTEGLRQYFLTHPEEIVVRRELFSGSLPEHLAETARHLCHDENPRHRAGWTSLANLLWHHHEITGGISAHDHAWRLFHLSQLLGLGAEEVRALTRDDATALLRVLDGFPVEKHRRIWQAAYESTYRDQVLDALWQNRGRGRWKDRPTRPRAQIAFCIDDREESFRRHVEEIDPEYETLGVAGFFGVAVHYQGLDDEAASARCPLGVNPQHHVREVAQEDAGRQMARHRSESRWQQAVSDVLWELRRSLVGSYFLVDLVGAVSAVPLLGRVAFPGAFDDVANRVRSPMNTAVPTRLTVDAREVDGRRSGFTTAEQADRVEATLRNMGLTSGFGAVVLLFGHGSISVNNPHLSAYDCGACGGNHGGPNARLFAAMANAPEVRAVLATRGIVIPDDTWFVGAEHNTCNELLTYYDTDVIPASNKQAFAELVKDMEEARRRSAHERARRFRSAPRNPTPERALRHVQERAVDLSQARPELGHATNACAVVGRRSLTRGVFLDRRAFLISYDATQDPTGSILERILMAVGPVGAGINLEYYFSTVDNLRFGCGSKVVHNVNGLLGVMDGPRSDLRTGLPKQMVEIHEPMRLQMIVEASTETLGAIYGRQKPLQELIGNAWVHLVAVDPHSGEASVFTPGRGFVPWTPPGSALPTVKASSDWYREKADFIPPALIQGDRHA